MLHVSGRGVSCPLPVGGRLLHFKDRWNKTLSLSPWHLQALEGVPIDWERATPENKPFDSTLRFPPGSKERVACTKTLQHYLAIGSVRPLPSDTRDGLWSTFFGHTRQPVVDLLSGSQERHRQDAGMCQPPLHERVHQVRALQDGGLTHGSSNAPRNDYITKIDISDFYHHFLMCRQDSKVCASCGKE